MAKQTVALYTVTSGDRVERARTSLAEALAGADLGDPDDAGSFEVALDAESPEAARELVREAFARAGTGDDFVIREGTEGREMADDDPRQGDVGKGAAAAAAAGDDAEGRAEGGDGAAPDPASRVADAAGADSARAAASDYASSAQESQWSRFAPIGALLLLLMIVRRRRRRY